MQKKLTYLQIDKNNEKHFESAKSLWFPFIREVNEHDGTMETEEEILDGLRKRISIQGSRPDMHFEIAFLEGKPVGIAMFAIDTGTVYGLLEAGYGTIMGFYIKPENRRKGLGREFFRHIEEILKKDGAPKIYLTPDGVTGEPFWRAVGFTDSGKIDPDNKMPIYIKDIEHEIITITVSDYLSVELAGKIALAQWRNINEAMRVKDFIYSGKTESDCFNVVAQDGEKVIGRLFCLKNQSDQNLWYYGDLFVIPEYRRKHIAEKMLLTAIDVLKDRECQILRSYVEPDNVPSLNMQRKFGFVEKPFKTFDSLINDGDLMFEKELGSLYNAILVNVKEDTGFVAMFYNENVEPLHGITKTYDEWCELLSQNDPDEAHFIIHKGAMPVAWLKLNGISDGETGWISMLAVDPSMQHKGAGKYAIEFSEKYFRSIDKKKVGIHTTDDNIPAQNLYKKCGYEITEYGKCTTGDGMQRMGYTFIKNIT